jgi:hypothetical protein
LFDDGRLNQSLDPLCDGDHAEDFAGIPQAAKVARDRQ